ncbi:uncharacterized protein [Henckelia pumila]|uniref:uncharacterized protein isoform X2 n=1 Tax=Henckelia pumila TaxID=405737 RepID=UPI003C6DC5BF
MESPKCRIVVKVNGVSCREYKKRLEEEFIKLNVDDVDCSLDRNLEKNHVSVTGRSVDSDLLLETIGRTRRYAEVVQFTRNSVSSKSNAYPNDTGKCPHDTGNPCNNSGHRFEKDEEEHKCEPYLPPQINGRICRDFWCKQHKQRPIFHDKVPASASAGMFGNPFHFANNPWEQYGRYPGYDRRTLPPTAYGFGSGGYMPWSSGFYDYGFQSW